MRQPSSYPKPFKAQMVQECLQPGATIVSVRGIRLAQISQLSTDAVVAARSN